MKGGGGLMQRKEVKEIRWVRGQATFEERDETIRNSAVKIIHINYDSKEEKYIS